jgi:osmotically-inducible protein OsmY
MNMKRVGIAVASSLVGSVSSATIKSEAERIARATSGVKDVHNELLVGTARH